MWKWVSKTVLAFLLANCTLLSLSGHAMADQARLEVPMEEEIRRLTAAMEEVAEAARIHSYCVLLGSVILATGGIVVAVVLQKRPSQNGTGIS